MVTHDGVCLPIESTRHQRSPASEVIVLADFVLLRSFDIAFVDLCRPAAGRPAVDPPLCMVKQLMTITFDEYIRKIEADYRRGIATEHTYRGTLERLIESFARGVIASNDPKHIACGAPDFIVEKGKVPLGYVETKDIGVGLDQVEKSEQMRRYLEGLNNLILTDYLEFRWYVNGARKDKIHVAEIGKNNRLIKVPGAAELLDHLFYKFFSEEVPIITAPKELAKRLAAVTGFIRNQIIQAMSSVDAALKKGLEDQYTAFRDLLLPGLKPEEFADLYAQTMTYGLFAAKLSAPEKEKFTLLSAYQFLFGNKFLRRLFSDVSEELDEIDIIRPYLQDIVSLLNRADMGSIQADFGRRARSEDPVVHFYETFLAAYDPRLRKSRGVYYTPEPVVQFIVRAVDDLLKTRFGKPWGLADSSVKVLDPATGTGTFLYYVIQKVHEEVAEERRQGGQWASVSKELLERLFGFELLVAPYVVAHLKLSTLLRNLKAPLSGRGERIQVYLTNTLEEPVTREEHLTGFGNYIAEESSDAAQVKRLGDIMVVLGNPPYSYESFNNGPWISSLVRDYYYVDGISLGEANPKGLQDDYVKFIRYGEWRINQTGYGILALITNHGYIDNPTFRGLRRHLMKTFDEIFLLDLHGNSKKKERTPDGSKDENVFDIQQGVAIIFAIKFPKPEKLKEDDSIVLHADLWGVRSSKYTELQELELKDIKWEKLNPDESTYLFLPQDHALKPEYEKGWRITDIFQIFSVGLYSARDNLAIQFTQSEIENVINSFPKLSIEEAHQKHFLSEDSEDWKISWAQADINSVNNISNNIVPISYRPFDQRYTFYTGKTKGFHCRPRAEVMKHLNKQENLALVCLRRSRSQDEWKYIFVGFDIIDKSFITSLDNASVFPVYLYSTPEETSHTLFAQTETTREPNLSLAFVQALSGKLGLAFIPDGMGDGRSTFGPEDVFHYAYAVFHSPTYRSRYAEFLKIDFARLPLTSDRGLFFALAALGRELTALHLLKSPRLDEFITTYPAAGSNRVEKVGFTPEPGQAGLGRAWINAAQYFGGVPVAVWQFKVGGYQVCEKWLKDRRGRVLTGEDIRHYQRVVVSLRETIRLMEEVDRAIPKWPVE